MAGYGPHGRIIYDLSQGASRICYTVKQQDPSWSAGSLQTSVPSWDTEVSSRQSVSGQQQHPAEAAMGVPMPSMQTLSAHTPRSQSSGSATLGHQPSAWPPMPSGLNSGRTAADPFAVFPTSSIHTAASYPARGSSLASGSSLTGNSRGELQRAMSPCSSKRQLHLQL